MTPFAAVDRNPYAMQRGRTSLTWIRHHCQRIYPDYQDRDDTGLAHKSSVAGISKSSNKEIPVHTSASVDIVSTMAKTVNLTDSIQVHSG